MPYTELHCLSNFSFLRGASHPVELVAQAKKLGYSAIAITDECSLAGIVKAHVAAKECGIRLIVGSEFELDGLKLVLLVPDREAYTELSTLITLARRRCPKGHYALSLSDLERHCRHCLILWLPGMDGETELLHIGKTLQQHFAGRLWLAVELLLKADEQTRYLRLYQVAETLGVPMVASGDVHMHRPERKRLQDALTAIRLNTPIQALGNRLYANAERHLRPPERLRKLYPPELLEETQLIADRCRFSLDELRYEYPHELVPDGMTPGEYLRMLVKDGAEQRWPDGVSPRVHDLIEKELVLIGELAYEYFFLTVHDIVYFARSQDILCQGRGSAANSVVCYCLFITEVDPARMSMLFERFISKERNEPPDIDVDFEHERREEVIQYIYRKYGRERAALAATVITYRPKSAVRDIGKALGLDTLFVDSLAKSLAWWDRRGDLDRRFEEANLAGTSNVSMLFAELVQEILGFPRHLSQHVGGFLITSSPVATLVPVENAAMADRTVIQWDKEDIEALGLLKVDILALGILTALRKCFTLIESTYDTRIGMADIPAEDPKTYAMLQRADSIGVFQVESRAQMAMLPRLKPRTFYDLVIEVAIVRPGPIQGDMVHPYLKRRQGIEPVSYPNEEVKAVLERTLGVPIFQEQVIKLAMVAAGFSGGEADQLRRAMASWGKNGSLQRFEKKVIDGMLARGHSQDFAERLFAQMKGFGDYGFPESHSASFALLAYASAWLKCHYPGAFCCALLNSQPMGFYSPDQLVQDLRRHDIEVKPVDVRYSGWDSSLESEARYSIMEPKPALRLGLHQVKGFGQVAAKRLLTARQRGEFANLHDLSKRADLNRQELEALASANTLTGLAAHRYQVHWQAQAVEESRPLLDPWERGNDTTLDDDIYLPGPNETEDMIADYASLGLTLGRHPMAMLRGEKPFRYCKQALALSTMKTDSPVRVAGLVTGRQRPSTASGVLFLTLEDETGNINIVIWSRVQERYRQALLTGRLLLVRGRMESRDSVIHVIAGQLFDHSQALETLAIKSRDFH